MKSRWNRGTSFAMIAVAGVLGAGIPATVAHARAQDTQATAEGEAALARGRQAMTESRWQDAINAFTEALRTMPDNAEARNGVETARAMLDRGSTVSRVSDDWVLQNDRAKKEFDAAVAQAEQQLSMEDFAGARQTIVTANVRLKGRDRQWLSESEFSERAEIGEALDERIAEAEVVARQRAEQAADEVANATKAEQLRSEARERQEKVNQLVLRVRALQEELKYGEALQVVDQILFLDPLNPTAQLLRDAISTAAEYQELVVYERRMERGISHLQKGVADAKAVPQPNIGGPGPRSTTGIMEYPPDWTNLTVRRTGAAGYMESDAERRTRVALSAPITVDFTNNDLEQVVAYLKQVTGVQFYADWKALDFSGVSKEDQITLKLGEVSADRALERIIEQLGDESDRPEWAIEDGIVVISSREALRKKTTTIVYDIRDLLFEVPYFDNAPEFDIEAAVNQGQNGGSGGGGSGGGFGGGGGGGGGGGQGGGSGGGGGSLFGDGDDQEIDRIDREELIQRILDIIQEQVDTDGWKDNGGDTGSIQELNGNLIITNTPKNHREIENLLGQLREIRSLQINVEGRLLTVAMDWFEQIGIDLDLYFNTNNSLFNAAREVDPNFQLKDFFNQDGTAEGTLKDPVVFAPITGQTNLPDGVANTVNTGGAFGVPDGTTADPGDIVYVTGPVGQPLRATKGFTPINFQQGSYGANGTGLVNQLAELGTFGATAAVNPALAAGVSFLDDIQVDLLINATQADRRTVTLTAPRLTLFNGQRSWIAVQFTTTFVSGLTPVTGDNSGAFEPEIGFLREGFVLDVEAVISADRRYVTMTVIFDLNNNEGFRESNATEFGGAAGGGADGDDGGDAGRAGQFTGRVELPQLSTTQVRTTVSVPDKGTILLGGQRVSNEIEVETGVPILSKIPIVNRFFTNRVTSKDEQSLLLLIRPEIIIQEENEEILFPGLSDTAGTQ